MKKQFTRMLAALVIFAGLAVGARAQADHVDVKIPFEFSVAGKTLPAGNYRVTRLTDRDLSKLLLTSVENGAGAILLPAFFQRASGDKAQLTFERVGDLRVLSRIDTGDYVFVFPASGAPPLLASAKPNASSAPTTSSGSN